MPRILSLDNASRARKANSIRVSCVLALVVCQWLTRSKHHQISCACSFAVLTSASSITDHALIFSCRARMS
jgi:hypothetical protein